MGMHHPAGQRLLIARQASMLSGYHYRVADEAGLPVGELRWPNMAQARNARARWHGKDADAGTVKILCGAQAFRVEFEYLDRGWANNTRYFLTRVGEPEARAQAELIFPSQRPAAGQITLQRPFNGRLVRQRRWWRQCFIVEAEGREMGRIEERRWLTLVRELSISLPPQVDVPSQLFLLFLACHLIHNQA